MIKYLYFGPDFNRLCNTPFRIFSIFADEIDNPLAEFNDLCELRKRVNISHRKLNYEKVFFIGTGMVERGAVSLKQELELVKFVNQYWKLRGKIMYYIGKRATSAEKLRVFRENGIKTLQFELPLELVLTELDDLPGYIFSLGSTLQKSVPILLNNKIECYYLNVEEFFKKRKDLNDHEGLDEIDHYAVIYAQRSDKIKLISIDP